MTPLHVATFWGESFRNGHQTFLFIRFSVVTFLGRENAVRTLIEVGAKEHAEDRYEETPLFNAVY